MRNISTACNTLPNPCDFAQSDKDSMADNTFEALQALHKAHKSLGQGMDALVNTIYDLERGIDPSEHKLLCESLQVAYVRLRLAQVRTVKSWNYEVSYVA